MKISKVIKVLYYRDPFSFGYNSTYPWTITDIYNKVVKITEVDNTDTILVSENVNIFLDMYIEKIQDAIQEWYSITK